jgi:thiol-disulfide isomerase/thioredoxin
VEESARSQPTELASFDPREHAGKVLYVDFWASWCAPCRLSFPFMQSLDSRFRDLGLEVIAIDVGEDRAKAEAFLKESGATFAVVFDPEGKLASAYELQGMPTTLLFDRSGRLRERRVGFRKGEEPELISRIQSLLEEEVDHGAEK